jgi:hypothetical protein
MLSWDNPDDRVAIVRMNAELRHAQLELLSAECATHQLRLRFSAEDLASFAQRDVLQKAIHAAGALNDYFSSIEKLIPAEAPDPTEIGTALGEQQVARATSKVLAYFREQRDRHYAAGESLGPELKAAMRPFFSPAILDRVRIVELEGTRLPNPSFYADARAMGFVNLPQIPHMSSLTFIDVVVFNEKLTDRALFHGLVHAAQFLILGTERYIEAFVRGFLRTQSHFNVPLEAHTLALELKFVRDPASTFSVEEQVRIWMKEGRY